MTTTKKRKIYTSELKAKVALGVARGRLTINQTAKEFEVHPVNWLFYKKASY